MALFYNPQITQKIYDEPFVIDTNILSAFFLDDSYLQAFLKIFPNNQLLLDPIVKLEFLRGAFRSTLYEEQKEFLGYLTLADMTDTPEIQTKINDNIFHIARIYSYQGKPNIPLGDIFIIARLAVYDQSVLFLTRDYDDFNTILFDRKAVISIERRLKNKSGPKEIVEHLQILQFNHEKYQQCLETLPH